MKSSTNFGFLDTSVALRYINANIQSFGGDPDRITITGILKKAKQQKFCNIMIVELFFNPRRLLIWSVCGHASRDKRPEQFKIFQARVRPIGSGWHSLLF